MFLSNTFERWTLVFSLVVITRIHTTKKTHTQEAGARIVVLIITLPSSWALNIWYTYQVSRNVRSHQNRIHIEVKWPQNGALQFKRAQWLNWLIPCMRQLWMDSFKCHHTVRKFKSFARFWCVYFSIVMCSYRGECTHLSTKHSPFSLHE